MKARPTTAANLAFLVLAAALLVQFVRAGGMLMPAAMGSSPDGDGPDDDGLNAYPRTIHDDAGRISEQGRPTA